MVKSFFYGVFLGLIIGGIGWFSFGRNDLGQIRRDFDGAYGDFKIVQRTVGELTDNSDGFAREISGIGSTSQRITNRTGVIEKGFVGVDGEIRIIAGEVDKLEDWNRQSVILGRDLGDIAFELRRLREESREEK